MSASKPGAGDAGGATLQAVVTDALRTVIEPELGLNIVTLGLVYDVEMLGDRAGGGGSARAGGKGTASPGTVR